MAQVARETHRAQKKAWEEEWPFTVELLPLDALFADKYQRPVLEPFVQQMTDKFDPSLVGVLDVSARNNGVSWAILDGRQRHEVIGRVGKKSSYCAVYSNMSIRDEAKFFNDKNRERRNMHPFYSLRARRIAGEKSVEEIFKDVERCGFKLGAGVTRGAPGSEDIIVAIVAIEQVYGMSSIERPEGALVPTLNTIRAAYLGRDGALSGDLLRGVGRFFQSYPDIDLDREHLVESLADMSPKNLVGRAKDRAVNSRHSSAYWIVHEMVALYNKKVARSRKLSTQVIRGKAA